MKIYIVRHGETQWNIEKRMQGWGNSNLTDLGIKQATLLGKSLLPTDFIKVFSSPLGRAIDTTNHIIGDRNLDITICEDFKEMGFGHWEGVNPSKLRLEYPEQYSNFWSNAHKYSPAGGETFEAVHNRVISGIHYIASANQEGNILLVTHGMIIQVLLLHIKGLPLERLWDRPVVHAASLTVIEVDSDFNMRIIKEDEITHLENL